jgi:hypothetical protein
LHLGTKIIQSLLPLFDFGASNAGRLVKGKAP